MIYQIFIANIFGLGSGLDVFFASKTLVIILLAIATISINSAITPIFIKHYKDGDYKTLKELANSFFNLIFLTFLFFAIILYIFSHNILSVMLPGFSEEQLITTIYFFRIQAFLSIFIILSAVFVALHYTFKNYYRTVLFPVAGLVTQLLFVWLFHKQYGIYSLVYGLVLNHILVFLLQGMTFVKYYRPKIVLNGELKDASKKIYPLIFSSSFSKSNIVVDRFFASTLATGSIAFLQYGQRIIKTISNLINKGISIVSLRKFSLLQDNEKEFQKLFNSLVKIILFIIIPVTFVILFFLKDALNLIVLSNKLSNEDVRKLYLVTIAFLGFFIGGSLNSPITNAFYAKGLTNVISRVVIVFQSFGIVLKVVLFYIMGFWGLPIAFSINSIFGVIVLFILYNKYIHKVNIFAILKYGLKVIIITIAAIIPSQVIWIILPKLWYVRLPIEFMVFIILFSLFSKIFENDVSYLLFNKIKLKRSET